MMYFSKAQRSYGRRIYCVSIIVLCFNLIYSLSSCKTCEKKRFSFVSFILIHFFAASVSNRTVIIICVWFGFIILYLIFFLRCTVFSLRVSFFVVRVSFYFFAFLTVLRLFLLVFLLQVSHFSRARKSSDQ